MRIFIAAELSSVNKSRIGGIQSQLHSSGWKAKWVKPDLAHITLKFLGETDDAIIGVVKNKLESCLAGEESFVVSCAGLGFFPDARCPRVVWLGMESGKKELILLASKVDTAMAELGFKKECRPLAAHITLGRFKFYSDNKTCGQLQPGLPCVAGFEQKIRRISLIKSVLAACGPVHEILYSFNLKEFA